MSLRGFYTLLAVALLGTAPAVHAAVYTVESGGSIQSAIDGASPGDTILVEPGTYTTTDAVYGLQIRTDNLRLIGKVDKDLGQAGKVIILKSGTQETGIYAAPPGCEYGDDEGTCGSYLEGFYLRGFSVKGFPENGIQTRWVNDFKIIRNESIDNLNNGIYPTLSADGLVQNNVSYGSLDTSMWVAGSERVRVIGNELYGSPIGFEITVSNDVLVTHNDIHDNTVGIGLFHRNGAGNPPKPVMANWVIENNNVYDNNLPNPAPPQSFQAGLPPGVGIFLLGISDHVIAKNTVENNDFIGIGVLGWCTATLLGDRNCFVDPPRDEQDPAVGNNLISQNELNGNGLGPSPIPGIPGVDILFAQTPDGSAGEPETGVGNCFEKNSFETFLSLPDGFFGAPGELPTDGC